MFHGEVAISVFVAVVVVVVAVVVVTVIEGKSEESVRVTFYRDLLDNDDVWKRILANPKKYILEVQPALSTDNVIRMWSLCFNGRKDKGKATSFNYSASVQADSLDSLLEQSGIAGIFFEPLTQDFKRHRSHRVVWFDDTTMEEAMLKSRTISTSRGLARAQHGLGIRVREADFEAPVFGFS